MVLVIGIVIIIGTAGADLLAQAAHHVQILSQLLLSGRPVTLGIGETLVKRVGVVSIIKAVRIDASSDDDIRLPQRKGILIEILGDAGRVLTPPRLGAEVVEPGLSLLQLT